MTPTRAARDPPSRVVAGVFDGPGNLTADAVFRDFSRAFGLFRNERTLTRRERADCAGRQGGEGSLYIAVFHDGERAQALVLSAPSSRGGGSPSMASAS